MAKFMNAGGSRSSEERTRPAVEKGILNVLRGLAKLFLQNPQLYQICESQDVLSVAELEDASSKGGMHMEQVGTSSNPKGTLKLSQTGRGMKRTRMLGIDVELEQVKEKISKESASSRGETMPSYLPRGFTSDLEKSGIALLGHRFGDAAATVPIKKRKIHMIAIRSPSPPARSPSPHVWATCEMQKTLGGRDKDRIYSSDELPASPLVLTNQELYKKNLVKGDREYSSKDLLLAEEEMAYIVLTELKEVKDVSMSLETSNNVNVQVTHKARQDEVEGSDHEQNNVECKSTMNKDKCDDSAAASSIEARPSLPCHIENAPEVEAVDYDAYDEYDESISANERAVHRSLDINNSESNRAVHEVAVDSLTDKGSIEKCDGWIDEGENELEEIEDHVVYGEDVLECDERMAMAHHLQDEEGDYDDYDDGQMGFTECDQSEADGVTIMHPRQEVGDSDTDFVPDSYDFLEDARGEALKGSENEIEEKEPDGVPEEEGNAPDTGLLDGQEENEESRSELNTSRAKSSGWDQLPEGFDSVEDALRAAAKENSERRGGRGGTPWSNTTGRGLLATSTVSRLGRGLSRRGMPGCGSDLMLSGHEGYHVRRMEDDAGARFASRDFGCGRHPVRGGLLSGRARFEHWMKGSASSTSHQRSPSRYGGQAGFGSRGPSAPVNIENGSFISGHDGMSILRRGGLRSVIGSSRGGHGMTRAGLSMDVDFSGRVCMGPGRGGGIDAAGRMRGGIGPSFGHGARLIPDRQPSDRYRGHSFRGNGLDSYTLSQQRMGSSRREYSLSPRRNWDSPQRSRSYTRQECSLSPRRNWDSTPQGSRSRSRSPPRRRTSPRSNPGFGIGSSIFQKCSRSSHGLLSEAQARTLPHRAVVPSPKLMSVLSSRNQRSPPPKWSNDRREGDRNRDWDFKHVARRTSPHVVHGSVLMDERDRQVLASARQISPKHKHLEPFTSGRSGSVGKSTDGSTETRRGKREDDEGSSRSCPKDTSDKDKGKALPGSLRREREKGRDDERRREPSKFGRESKHGNGLKHGGKWEVDDDVAPRRRRPT